MQLRHTHAHVTVLREDPRGDHLHVLVGAIENERAQDAMDLRVLEEGRAEVRLADTATWVLVDLEGQDAASIAKAYEAARAAQTG